MGVRARAGDEELSDEAQVRKGDAAQRRGHEEEQVEHARPQIWRERARPRVEC